MTRTRYYTAATLDGFVAGPGDSLDWLLTRDTDRGGPMGYDGFMAGIGAMVMGGVTHRWIADHLAVVDDGPEGEWPYAIPCWVFTRRDDPPAIPGADIRFVRGDPAVVHPEVVAAAGDRDVWMVGGGDLAAQYAAAGLLDEVTVSIAPVTLGEGARLLPGHVELALREVARNGDFCCARYDVVRPAAPG
jgi:dihydrofolate reductase